MLTTRRPCTMGSSPHPSPCCSGHLAQAERSLQLPIPSPILNSPTCSTAARHHLPVEPAEHDVDRTKLKAPEELGVSDHQLASFKGNSDMETEEKAKVRGMQLYITALADWGYQHLSSQGFQSAGHTDSRCRLCQWPTCLPAGRGMHAESICRWWCVFK